MKAQHTHGAGNMTLSEESGAYRCEKVADPLRLEVKVLSCLSPSCIYVALLSQEEQIKK